MGQPVFFLTQNQVSIDIHILDDFDFSSIEFDLRKGRWIFCSKPTNLFQFPVLSRQSLFSYNPYILNHLNRKPLICQVHHLHNKRNSVRDLQFHLVYQYFEIFCPAFSTRITSFISVWFRIRFAQWFARASSIWKKQSTFTPDRHMIIWFIRFAIKKVSWFTWNPDETWIANIIT